MAQNPVGLKGISFVEFCDKDTRFLHQLFTDFGFSKTGRCRDKNIELYQQGQIQILLNSSPGTFAQEFYKQHGPSISSMGWKVQDSARAFSQAVERGARPFANGDYRLPDGQRVPAIYGIGDSLIYFVDDRGIQIEKLQDPVVVPDKGFTVIDHLTNNVYKGTMQTWAKFYKDIFGFTEVRYFDIRGKKTGLTSYALKSPCGSFCIPINEADEAKSQINEYLDEYRGPGIQHLAFLTNDLIRSIEALQSTSIETLDIDPEYYKKVFSRVPNVKEDKEKIERLNILVDGDDEGYLLQIFTRNLVGPIFVELIQRENHLSFGEGNFQALFDSIERDQMKRGVL